jgi:HPr kinase/phosphorylase
VTGTFNIHATGLLLEGRGVVLRGPSGSGKSLLALSLIDFASGLGVSAQLVGDDRLDISIANGRLLMRPPALLAGLIELRGRGIIGRPFAPEAPVDLVADLVPDLPRMPEEAELRTTLCGISVARCLLPVSGNGLLAHQVLLIRQALAAD